MFVRILPDQKQSVVQSDHVARLLPVSDQELLTIQLDGILRVLSTDLNVYLVPEICTGSRVRIKAGPLRGVEGWVMLRAGVTTIHLRVDFIGQAAALQIEADQLEPL